MFIIQESPELLALACLLTAYNSYFSVLLIALLFFYRSPELNPPYGDHLLSPAFGTVSRIVKQNDRTLVTIFLNVYDYHAQYYPCKGIVVSHVHDETGQFAIASDAYKSDKNEKTITTIRTDVGMIVVTQIAGLLVRRISTEDRAGMYIDQAQYLGFIKFGSRVDIEFPTSAFGPLLVRVGDYVDGPNTILVKKK